MTPTSYTEIGAFEAKAKLSEILRKVEQGERFTITRRGRPIAEIGPPHAKSEFSRAQAIEALLDFPRIEGISGETVLEWIREGRRY